MAAENNDTDVPRFEMNGETYELPNIRELTMDEWMLMYDYSKVVLRDLMEIEDPEEERARLEKLEQPGVMMALFHIGYKRKHPQKTDAAVRALVGQIQYLPTLQEMSEEEEGPEEEDPTTDEPQSSENEPSESSERSSDSSTENGSSDSGTSSGIPEDLPATIGTSG